MNDTNLNDRQKKILQTLQEGASPKADLSKITFIRDLNFLIANHFVKRTGKGKNTRYSLVEKNPFLTYLDLKNYFETDFEERKIRTNFNPEILEQLKNLYDQKEMSLCEKAQGKFIKAKAKLDPSIYKRELERFVIELSWKSSQIEGNTYTLLETEALIKQNIQAKGHSEEEARMILNHKTAFDVILKKKDSFKTLYFADVVQLHQVLTKGLATRGGI